jgi:hypothetical protein
LKIKEKNKNKGKRRKLKENICKLAESKMFLKQNEGK